jgi:hypothetical protein
VLYLEYSFDGAENWTLRKVDQDLESFELFVLEKDGKDQLD